MTLNAAKCQFSMDKLTFVGMVLSANGISCAADKVEAVTSAREPQNASETRRFLGLVNYCGRFIPDLATISEPLRRLTKVGTPFLFGKEQKEAFDRGIEEAPIKFRDFGVFGQRGFCFYSCISSRWRPRRFH